MRTLLRLLALPLVSSRMAAALAAEPNDVRPICPDSSAADYFFAFATLDPTSARSDEFRRQWYSVHLRAMSEASLSCGIEKSVTSYRFTWLRTFHHPIAVRVTNSTGVTCLVAVELDGAGGYAPGGVKNRVQKTLTPEQWAEIQNAIEASDFWSEATQDPARTGFDGAQWVVEGERNESYHVVDRWSPEQGTQRDLGTLFLNLSGLLPQSGNEVH